MNSDSEGSLAAGEAVLVSRPDSELSLAADEAVLVSRPDSELSLAADEAVLVSLLPLLFESLESSVSQRYIGLELTLIRPESIEQISAGSTGESLAQDRAINPYPRFRLPFPDGIETFSTCTLPK